MRNVPNEDL